MRYYVYVHRKPDSGEIFYVGKGKGQRAYKVTERNPLWTNIYQKYGRVVEVVLEGLTEAQAFSAEMDFIAFFGRVDIDTGCLTNMTDGGEGSSGYKWRPCQKSKLKQRVGMSAPRTDKSIWTFHNIFTGETIETTRLCAERDYPKINTYTPYYKHSATRDGWIINERFDFKNLEAIKVGWTIEHNWNSKTDKHDIINVFSDEILLQVSRNEMEQLGILSSALILRNVKISNGWVLKDSFVEKGKQHFLDLLGNKGVLNGRADTEEYTLVHCRTLEEFVGKRWDFEKKYGVKIADLFYENPTMTSHGWALKDNFIKYNLKEKIDSRKYLFEHVDSCTIVEATRKEFKYITGCDPKFFFKSKPYKISCGWKLLGLS